VGNVSTMARSFTLNQVMLASAASTMAVGALGVLNVVQGFVSCVLIGVGMTTGMIAGMVLGEQDRASAEKLVRVAMRTAFALGVALAVVVFAFAGVIAPLFGSSSGEEMVRLATRGLHFYAFSVILFGVNNAFVNYTQGMRRTGLSACYCFLQNFVFVAIPALALHGILDSDAVWVAYPVGEALTTIAIFALAAAMKHGLPTRAKDFVFLKEPFGAPDDEVLDIAISDMDHVVPACERAASFCRAWGADEKTRYRVVLFIEELGSNAAEYSFAEGKGGLLEIRIVHLSEEWVLRLRDNGRAFDPVKWIELNASEDPSVNMGIKLVCGMAKDVAYVSTLDLNIITLRIWAFGEALPALLERDHVARAVLALVGHLVHVLLGEQDAQAADRDVHDVVELVGRLGVFLLERVIRHAVVGNLHGERGRRGGVLELDAHRARVLLGGVRVGVAAHVGEQLLAGQV
jgi:anti-sigma regulatory factor (Ser/Thr protein kinase)